MFSAVNFYWLFSPLVTVRYHDNLIKCGGTQKTDAGIQISVEVFKILNFHDKILWARIFPASLAWNVSRILSKSSIVTEVPGLMLSLLTTYTEILYGGVRGNILFFKLYKLKKLTKWKLLVLDMQRCYTRQEFQWNVKKVQRYFQFCASSPYKVTWCEWILHPLKL